MFRNNLLLMQVMIFVIYSINCSAVQCTGTGCFILQRCSQIIFSVPSPPPQMTKCILVHVCNVHERISALVCNLVQCRTLCDACVSHSVWVIGTGCFIAGRLLKHSPCCCCYLLEKALSSPAFHLLLCFVAVCFIAMCFCSVLYCSVSLQSHQVRCCASLEH